MGQNATARRLKAESRSVRDLRPRRIWRDSTLRRRLVASRPATLEERREGKTEKRRAAFIRARYATSKSKRTAAKEERAILAATHAAK